MNIRLKIIFLISLAWNTLHSIVEIGYSPENLKDTSRQFSIDNKTKKYDFHLFFKKINNASLEELFDTLKYKIETEMQQQFNPLDLDNLDKKNEENKTGFTRLQEIFNQTDNLNFFLIHTYD